MAANRRTALVTGANRGIGWAVSKGLMEENCAVVVAAREFDAAADAARRLGAGATPVALDVTSDASVAAAREAVGPVDILVNNAGVLLDAGNAPDLVPLDLVADTLAVNTLGSWRVSQAFLPAMRERGWGRVVMVTSGTATFGNGLFAATPGYTVSKVALNAVAVLLAAATAGTGVLVNAVNPGRVRTRMMPGAVVEPEEAAADIVWAATLPDDGPSGTLLRARRPIAW